MTVPYITLWIDEPKIGCGYRYFLILKTGPKWCELFHAPSLQRLKMPTANVARAKTVATDARAFARRIVETRRERKRLGLHWSKPATDAALAILTEHQPVVRKREKTDANCPTPSKIDERRATFAP